MHARLIPISFCLITTFIYLTNSADPRRDPTFEENVIRGLQAASKFQTHFERMELVRAWSTVDLRLSPSSDWWDFKNIEIDVYFINYQLQRIVGFLEGANGSDWGSWPYRWGVLWEYKAGVDEPFDFVLEVNVPQNTAAGLANRAGDMGPWTWILLCQPNDLNITEPTWFFRTTNAREATAVGATTGTVIKNVAAKEICVGPYEP